MAVFKTARPAGKDRYALPDTLRGLTLLSMIAYHGCWDMVYILGADWPWYGSTGRLPLAAEHLLDLHFAVGIQLFPGATATGGGAGPCLPAERW